MFQFTFTDLRIILRDFGEVTYYFSAAFILPIIVSLIYMEGFNQLMYYVLPGIATLLVGLAFKEVFDNNRETKKTHAFTMVILVWFLIPLFASFPYMLHGVPLDDAYFDSVSAFTTTGITPLRTQGAYPNSLMFWRSAEAWIGGAGIIVLALVGIFTYIKSYKLYKAEGREERLRPSVKGTAKRIWWIYTLLTAFGVILLLLSGLGLFESINYSMSAISTNGMDMAWRGLANMNNVLAEASLAVIMLLGSFSFYIHYQFLKKKWKAYLGDIQVKLALLLLAIGILITLPKFIGIYGATSTGLRYSAFHSVSALTAGGFHAASAAQWGGTIKLAFILLMFVGGSAGSTAGGIKVIRFWVFLKSIYWKIKEAVLPQRAHFSRKIQGEEATDTQLSTIYIFILLYLLFIAAGALVITSAEGAPLGDALFATTSSQGNVGLMVGITRPGMTLATKAVLVFNMVVGRIEIIPILYGVGFLLKYKKKPSLNK